MKKLFLFSLLALSLTITGCSLQKGLSEDELFKKKLECANYRTDIEKVILEKSKSKRLSESFYELDQLFYSPSKNSCIYSYAQVSRQGRQRFVNGLYIVDHLANESIYENNDGLISSGALLDYNKRIEKLKEEEF